MDELERSLRELLTDERLDVPVRPGAADAVHDGVRRRRAATRGLLAVSAVVAVSFGAAIAVNGSGLQHKAKIALGGEDPPGKSAPPVKVSPQPTVSKPPPPQRIAWDPRPYHGATFLNADTTACRPEQITLALGEFQGATGAAAGPVRATNNGSECRLDGIPSVVGLAADGSAIAYQQPPQGDAVTATVKLQPGETAYALVAIYGDSARCLGPVDRLQVGIAGNADTPLEARWVDGGGVTPRCGTVPEDEQEDHYTLTTGGWEFDASAEDSSEAGLSATMRRPPASVMQGTFLRYQVSVDAARAGEHPCRPFRERLVRDDGSVVAEAAYLLPCPGIRTATTDLVYLDMQLYVPSTVQPGELRLEWETPDSQRVVASVRVTAAPSPCEEAQLQLRGRPGGVATGHYSGIVVFTNISSAACSLRGYPGIEFADPSGDPLPTIQRNGGSFTFPDVPVTTLALLPGASASAALGTVTMPTGNGSCEDVAGVLVIAPETRTQVLVKGIASDCDNGRIDVSPVVPGNQGPTFSR